MTTLTILGGDDGTATLNVRDVNGVAIDFTTATRFVAVHYGTTADNFTVDTSTDTGAITGDSEGNVVFAYQAIAPITEDKYIVKLTVYDASHPNGQIIADECCGPFLCLNICGNVTAASVNGAYFEVAILTFPEFGAEGPVKAVAGIYNTGTGPTVGDALGTSTWTGFYGMGIGNDDDIDFIENGVDVTATLSQTDVQAGSVFKVAVSGTSLWLGQFISGANVWYDSTGGTTGDPSAGTNPTMTVPAQTWLAFAGCSVGGS